MHTGRHARKSHMSDQCDERSRAGERKRHSKPYLELGLHTVAATV